MCLIILIFPTKILQNLIKRKLGDLQPTCNGQPGHQLRQGIGVDLEITMIMIMSSCHTQIHILQLLQWQWGASVVSISHVALWPGTRRGRCPPGSRWRWPAPTPGSRGWRAPRSAGPAHIVEYSFNSNDGFRRLRAVLQSRRRPLLGSSPGWKCLLVLSHLRHC